MYFYLFFKFIVFILHNNKDQILIPNSPLLILHKLVNSHIKNLEKTINSIKDKMTCFPIIQK